MLTLAGEVAKAATVDWDEDQLRLMVEVTLALRGLGHLSKVQEDLPRTPARDLRLDLPRCLPWEMTAVDLSSETDPTTVTTTGSDCWLPPLDGLHRY